MAVGLMDIKGQYAELQDRIEDAVLSVLRSGRVILGPNVKGFEEEASAFMGTTGSVGVANGTDGLTIALRALGIGPGDEVITVPFTFYATPEAIAQAGAKPVFVDIHPDTLCMDPNAIKAAITPRTKAVMPVDLFGLPADADAIRKVAEAHGLAVVEDACQAWGATYFGRRAGSLGDMGVFSFFPTKNLGGFGDGGLITGHSEVLVQRARELRFHGSKDKKTFTDIGFNSRLDELQAAILRLELQVIDEWNGRRALVAEWYDEYLPDERRASRRPRRPHARVPPLHDPPPAARRHRRRVQAAPGRLRRVLHHADAVAAGVRGHGPQAGRLSQHRRGRGDQPGHPHAPEPHRGAGEGSGRGGGGRAGLTAVRRLEDRPAGPDPRPAAPMTAHPLP